MEIDWAYCENLTTTLPEQRWAVILKEVKTQEISQNKEAGSRSRSAKKRSFVESNYISSDK